MIRGFVGSPNPRGMTATIVREALLGAEEQGAEVELVQLSDHGLSGCDDCREVHGEGSDWGPADGFAELAELLEGSAAVVLGSPVYWSDITSCTRALLARKLRVEQGKGPTMGMPALGIVVAGGSGNGLVEAMKPLYLLFEKLRWRPLPSFPVTRFNWDRAMAFAHEAGRDLAAMADRRRPLLETEAQVFYNDLRYRSHDRIDERRLLAELIVASLPDVGKFAPVANELRQRMRQVNTLFDRHRKTEAVPLIDGIVAEGTEIWEVLHPSARDVEVAGE
jgi:NAD(P)H-dependent FMN reductase